MRWFRFSESKEKCKKTTIKEWLGQSVNDFVKYPEIKTFSLAPIHSYRHTFMPVSAISNNIKLIEARWRFCLAISLRTQNVLYWIGQFQYTFRTMKSQAAISIYWLLVFFTEIIKYAWMSNFWTVAPLVWVCLSK